MSPKLSFFIIASLLICFGLQGCSQAAKEVERPERIVSKRIVVYDADTYKKLGDHWQAYYDAFPSEDAYANWMYAARYAGDSNYPDLLEKGYKKYSANPTILYLYAMQAYDCHGDLEGQRLMERAAELDPLYDDPVYGLITCYIDSDDEKLDVALKRLLELGAIADEVMDYNYNTLMSLEKDAILITNGDMDTYPVWVLQRILKIRTDVNLINRSLLNTDWYPNYLVKQGAPRFIASDELQSSRDAMLKQYKEKGEKIPSYGPYSDTLLTKVIEKATVMGRPVYFAATLYSSPVIDRFKEKGRALGIVTLVNPDRKPYELQIRELTDNWLGSFRTSGLDSWSLRHAKRRTFGRSLAMNYAAGLHSILDDVKRYAPNKRSALFHWYNNHLLELMPDKYRDEINRMWCNSTDIKEIRDWCEEQGLIE
ncbi:hypothetical protein KJ564_00530 [bacterium]|nr:hypothetical protein [bacterium]MBU1881232.1 hypothetical protein [bacterium]